MSESTLYYFYSVGCGWCKKTDPRLMELILSESKRIVRMENGIIIVETNHGFVCANAGIDESNVQDGYATLLPEDPDRSSNLLKERIEQKTGKNTKAIKYIKHPARMSVYRRLRTEELKVKK